jgi:hypothetical protein
MTAGLSITRILEGLSELALPLKFRGDRLGRKRWRKYQVTPRINPRRFRRELLHAAFVELKRI